MEEEEDSLEDCGFLDLGVDCSGDEHGDGGDLIRGVLHGVRLGCA